MVLKFIEHCYSLISFYLFILLAELRGMPGPSSPTRDQTYAPRSGSMKSQPKTPRQVPPSLLFLFFLFFTF